MITMVKSIVLVITFSVWAVVGLPYWGALLARVTAVFVFASMISAVTDRPTDDAPQRQRCAGRRHNVLL